ncbi:MAG TPA: C40 family peptidase [Vicinamibacterales bacterium]
MVRQVLLLLAIASSAGVACATSGSAGSKTAPVPKPFPGAASPTTTAPEPPPGAPPAVAAPGVLPTTPGVVATALTLRGTRYRDGGSEPSNGFDCSGFVQWVFAQHGTALPRDVKHQFDTGERVDARDLKPGDLVFFETVSRGPSHVGIAIGGDEFVHAPSSKGVVRIEKISSVYWSQRWVGAKRVAGATTPTDRLTD